VFGGSVSEYCRTFQYKCCLKHADAQEIDVADLMSQRRFQIPMSGQNMNRSSEEGDLRKLFGQKLRYESDTSIFCRGYSIDAKLVFFDLGIPHVTLFVQIVLFHF